MIPPFIFQHSFLEVFPFFKWLVTEVSFARYKDTGFTNVVDYGGEIPSDAGWAMPSRGKLNPQPQAQVNPNTGNNLSRTQSGGAPGDFLLQAMHLYAGQTNVIDWGKIPYAADDNGGISGIVFYAVTRAEDDPRYAAGEEWEAGIPNVQVVVYADFNEDGVIDDLNGDGRVTLADVDNYPLGWADGGVRGPEDVKRATTDPNFLAIFDPGDALNLGTTDSWDAEPPTGSIQDPMIVHGQPVSDFDNIGAWNQLRGGVFDGGFAFASYFGDSVTGDPTGMANPNNIELEPMPGGVYIVEAITPPGYEHVKEEDKNVDYGDEYVPSPLLLPAICAGDEHLVPDFLTMFADIEAPYAGLMRPLPDRKQVVLTGGANAAVEFFMYTEVPKAARAVGTINNDLAAEFDPKSPVFGEKAAPSWIPVAFFDYAGNPIARTYCDEYGAYNALLPSTYTVNIASPTGVSPHMIRIILNHPGPIPSEANPNVMVIDPHYDADFSITAYTFDFWPGKTTYLDTPVIPLAAFTGIPNRTLDVEPADGTPGIYSVMRSDGLGNFLAQSGPLVCGDGESFTITATGLKLIPNPNYDPTDPTSTVTITRDYGFGADKGMVTVDGTPVDPADLNWSNEKIIVSVPSVAGLSTGRLMVTRAGNGRTSELGVTLHVGDCGNVVHVRNGALFPDTPIQDAIDAAPAGALIIIEPGTYWETPIVWKNVRLQGCGSESTTIMSILDKAGEWQAKIADLVAAGDIILPAAEVADPFKITEAPAILVLANVHGFSPGSPGLIDGLTMTGSLAGGGVYIRDAEYVTVSNNKIRSNLGSYGGGVIIGGPGDESDPAVMNNNITIMCNAIVKNGGVLGGGCVSIYGGADNYVVRDNLIMGNHSRFKGGGVLHYGLNEGGLISGNKIAFNEVTSGDQIGGDAGGIFIGGQPGGSTLGSGNVTIIANLIQGNLAGSGSGGGIGIFAANGDDVLNSTNPDDWHKVGIFNNMIVNNVAALDGGGIVLRDAVKTYVVNNTVVHNDSMATAGNAFQFGQLTQSTPRCGGIVAYALSADLATASGETFADPALHDNIIWRNRSFYQDTTINNGQGGILPNPNGPYWDLNVIGTPAVQHMDPMFCILTSLNHHDNPAESYSPTNKDDDPMLIDAYLNEAFSAAVGDEGGNFLSIRFLPLEIAGDYHIDPNSPAVDLGGDVFGSVFAELNTDYDGDSRGDPDSGADEIVENFAADINLDGKVNVVDLTMVADEWLRTDCDTVPECVADVTGDNKVDYDDIKAIGGEWGAGQ